eukprot:2950510-Prymnesium_polylepis.1
MAGGGRRGGSPSRPLPTRACARARVLPAFGLPAHDWRARRNTPRARAHRLPHAVRSPAYVLGTDFKAGQTKAKTAIVEYLRALALRPRTIASYNHLGNNDMRSERAREPRPMCTHARTHSLQSAAQRACARLLHTARAERVTWPGSGWLRTAHVCTIVRSSILPLRRDGPECGGLSGADAVTHGWAGAALSAVPPCRRARARGVACACAPCQTCCRHARGQTCCH